MERYLEEHDNYWPDLKKEMIEGGFKNITCFLDGYNLFIYREYDEVVLQGKGQEYFVLNKKWAELMSDIIEPIIIHGKEVFHLSSEQ